MAFGVGEPQLGCRPSSKRIQFVCKSAEDISINDCAAADREVDARDILFTHASGSKGEQAVLQM